MDPEHYLFFTEFPIVLRENNHIIGSIDYKYVPADGVPEAPARAKSGARANFWWEWTSPGV